MVDLSDVRSMSRPGSPRSVFPIPCIIRPRSDSRTKCCPCCSKDANGADGSGRYEGGNYTGCQAPSARRRPERTADRQTNDSFTPPDLGLPPRSLTEEAASVQSQASWNFAKHKSHADREVNVALAVFQNHTSVRFQDRTAHNSAAHDGAIKPGPFLETKRLHEITVILPKPPHSSLPRNREFSSDASYCTH
ncbi:unnamed protein product [Pleuronectes platessa]|uniref:Uncharacterized protein n=1 Tax=Pleuronectes platessa TaxID=8262 RepID=A0A9N7VZA0_PLEPL|nr:unnamed protein product [Pleuronectes platessa]